MRAAAAKEKEEEDEGSEEEESSEETPSAEDVDTLHTNDDSTDDSLDCIDGCSVHALVKYCGGVGGESSSRSQHLNGNRLSVSRAEHSFNQCTIGLTRGPFIYSVFRAVNPSSVFLTPA